VLADDLTEAQIKAFRLVANQSANWAEWDKDLLRLELLDLKGMDFDLNLTGFDLSEVDRLIQENKTIQEDEFVEEIEENKVVTKPGDIWILGNHRLICGDAKDEKAINRLMADQVADMVFTRIKEESITIEQLPQTFRNLKNKTKDGGLFFLGINWQRMYETLSAGKSVFEEYKQLCVWNKGIAQQAELYKNQLELFFVFKKGEAKHTNNFGLGETGRYRTNVWSYRADEVPVQLAADAILDCSHINEIIFDPFGGRGTTMIASEETGRRCYMMEIDPKYCDTIIRRYEQYTGQEAILESINKTFNEMAGK
jgi:DNA modification methylase